VGDNVRGDYVRGDNVRFPLAGTRSMQSLLNLQVSYLNTDDTHSFY